MASNNKVTKRQSTKDGSNARQRRADKKRAARLTSEPHLQNAAANLRNRRYLQAQRWVDYEIRMGQIFGHENEIRWGLKTNMTFLLSDESQHTLDRMDMERRAALAHLNGERAKAGLGDVEWVDDWFGQTASQSVVGGANDHGHVAEGGFSEQQMEDVGGKQPEESDVEMGGV